MSLLLSDYYLSVYYIIKLFLFSRFYRLSSYDIQYKCTNIYSLYIVYNL